MRQKGFTLVEVMAVVSLIAILALGGYTIVNNLQEKQFEKTAYLLVEMVQFAQQKAALRNQKCELSCSQNAQGETELLMTSAMSVERTLPLDAPMTLWIGSESSYIGRTEKIIFTKDVSPTKSGTIALMHEHLPYHYLITVRPVTGKATLYRKND